MWQALQGFALIIFAIFVFALLSLPRRAKKASPQAAVHIPKAATQKREIDNSAALEQAAIGKESTSYTADQRVSSVPYAIR